MQKQSFNQNWRFSLAETTYRWNDPDSANWRTLTLPHDWSIESERAANNPSGTANGFFEMGRGWYRKEFQLSRYMRGKKVFVEFEGVYMNAEVWLNEHLLARHPYGYTSFTVDLTPVIKYDEPNILRVHVDNAAQLNSRWYSGSGIYRPVWLIVTENVHIGQYGVYVTTPEVGAQAATVRARTTVLNESDTSHVVTLRTAITAPDGSQAAASEVSQGIPPGSSFEFDQNLLVHHPRLWSLENPHLYKLSSEVVVEKNVYDTQFTTFGIRTLELSAEEGFLLNGQPVLLKGGCVHHDNGVLGAVSLARAEERKVEVLKASGFNAIRCAHNPPAPAMLAACDRLGMLVMDEAFDCWRIGKNFYDYHISFDDWWQRDLDSMVLRDRNHPSIVMWSVGNEILERDGRSGGVEIVRMLADRVRQLDPTRPVTAAICGVWDQLRTWEDTDAVFAHLDVGGYNYQWGQYASDHQRHPDRLMVGCESFPLEALDNWQMVEDNPYIVGDFVWTSLDYLGETGIGRVDVGDPNNFSLGAYPWHQANCGDLDICGFKRPQSYYRDMVWGHGTDKLYLAVEQPYPEGPKPVPTRWGWPDVWPNWNWPGREGETLNVVVYAACEKVELFLNGRSLGIQPTTRAERLTASFAVAYEPGELKAVGYVGEAVVAEKTLATTGAPAAIRLSADRAQITDNADLCYVTAEVVDAEGRTCPTAEHNLLFAVQGAGELAAVGSGNPTSTERYRGNQRRAYRGRCLAVVKSTGQGEIKLQAMADGLAGAALTIQAI
jgi:beta-galactosidase